MRPDFWKEILFPQGCPLCGALAEEEEDLSRAGLCARCSLEVYAFTKEEKQTLPRDTYVCFRYTGRLREALADLKYEGVKKNGIFFARWMVSEGRREKGLKQILEETDLLVSIPVSDIKKKERGYNQAEVMADEIAALTGIKTAELLERSRETGAQKKLGHEMRRRNLEEAFRMKEKEAEKIRLEYAGRSRPLTITVIDDIYTTGSTVFAAKKKILEAFPGAKVYLVTFSGRCADGYFEDPEENG